MAVPISTSPPGDSPVEMQSIRQVARLNETELEKVVPPSASWHTDYRDTAYVYIGGLPFELSEGDILTLFSQYGNPVDVKLVRDKDTGKSRGFAFLKYEDQRSCDLAVDNLSGAGVMGRVISVDHTRYKKKDGEVETVGDGLKDDGGDETDREDGGRRKRRRTESESEEERPMIKEEVELATLMREHDDDDPMKAYLVEQKKTEVEEALKAVVKKPREKERRHRHRHRHHRSRRDEVENDDGERRSNGHGPRRQRSEDGEERERKDGSYRSRRKQSASPNSADERDRRRHRFEKQDYHSEDERRRRGGRDSSSSDREQRKGRRSR